MSHSGLYIRPFNHGYGVYHAVFSGSKGIIRGDISQEAIEIFESLEDALEYIRYNIKFYPLPRKLLTG